MSMLQKMIKNIINAVQVAIATIIFLLLGGCSLPTYYVMDTQPLNMTALQKDLQDNWYFEIYDKKIVLIKYSHGPSSTTIHIKDVFGTLYEER